MKRIEYKYDIELIKKIIDEKGLKQTFIAKKTGIKISTLNNILRGASRATLNNAGKINSCLGIKNCTYLVKSEVPNDK